jgi:outer membrane protein assembly factor BamB
MNTPFSTLPCHAISLSLLMMAVAAADERGNTNWPQFHGPRASGIAEGFALPTHWDVSRGDHVKWSIEVPGLAHSGPVVWGDRLFLTTAITHGAQPQLKIGLYGDVESADENDPVEWKLFCLDKNTGKLIWEKTAHTGVPKVKRHPKSSHANSTPAVDGKRVVAFFGAEGLFCYELDGKPLWQKDLGPLDSGFYRAPDAQWGFASSPVLYDGKVLVQCDVQKDSFVAALDAADGHELWRTPRDEVPTWSTPTVYRSDQGTQVIVNGYKHIGAYDLKDGKPLWTLRGGGDIPVPTPIVSHDLVFITNAHGGESPIYAVRTSARGDVTDEARDDAAGAGKQVAWVHHRGGSYMQTPLVVGDLLYCPSIEGSITCYEAATGKQVYRHRFGDTPSGYTASPVAADSKLYFTSEAGEIYVLKAGPQFEVLAVNVMPEPCMASPAISEGVLFVRTQKHLYAIGDPPKTGSK